MKTSHNENEKDRTKENEKSRMEKERTALWLLLCRNVNTLQRLQKTMTPRGKEGASVFLLLCMCVQFVWGWLQQQHYGERNENDGVK